MDFYTLKTSIDLIDNNAALKAVISVVGFFSQPLLVGHPAEEDGAFVFRFAVREDTVRVFEDDIVINLSKTEHGFTKDNTQLIRAARI